MSEEKKAKKPAAKKAADKPVAKKISAKKADDSKAVAKETKKPAAKKDAAKATAPKAEKPAKKASPKKEKKADTGVKKQGKLIEDIRLYDVIVKPLITEKSTMAADQSKVVFQISPDANKQQVKDAVEALFGVSVTKVNTVLTKGKAKRFRGRMGQRNDMRKAIVTLKEGQSIDVAAGLK